MAKDILHNHCLYVCQLRVYPKDLQKLRTFNWARRTRARQHA